MAEIRNTNSLSVAADVQVARQIADCHAFANIRLGIDQRQRMHQRAQAAWVQVGQVQSGQAQLLQASAQSGH